MLSSDDLIFHRM